MAVDCAVLRNARTSSTLPLECGFAGCVFSTSDQTWRPLKDIARQRLPQQTGSWVKPLHLQSPFVPRVTPLVASDVSLKEMMSLSTTVARNYIGYAALYACVLDAVQLRILFGVLFVGPPLDCIGNATDVTNFPQ